MDKNGGKGIGKWLPIMLLAVMAVVAAGAGIHAAGQAMGRGQGPGNAVAGNNANGSGAMGTGQDGQDMEEGSVGGTGTDSAGVQGVVRAVNAEEKTITVYQIARMEEMVLRYNGATSVLSKYGRQQTMPQIQPGTIVRTEREPGSDLLRVVQEDDEGWVYKGVGNLAIDRIGSTMSIGENLYRYDAQITVINNGQLVELDTLHEKDVVTVRGIEERIYSIQVEKGHGMLTFANYGEFIGGSIEVGYDVFDQINEGMEYVLREGSYKLVMRNGSLEVNRYITISRDQTMLMDLSQFMTEAGKKGLVYFTLNPVRAKLYLDDEEVELDGPLELGYGEYILEVQCDGYEPLSRVLTVSMPTANIRIDLADGDNTTSDGSLTEIGTGEGDIPDDGDDIGSGAGEGSAGEDGTGDSGAGDSGSGEEDEGGIEEIGAPDDERIDELWGDGEGGNNEAGGGSSGSGGSDEGSSGSSGSGDGSSSSGGNSGGQVITGHYIMIRRPEGASVYFDGAYAGVAPLQIEKVTGEHTITFRRDGYISKTYTIEVENDSENPQYSFPDLTKE